MNRVVKVITCVILLSSFALVTTCDAKTTPKKKAQVKIVKVVAARPSENVIFNFSLPSTFAPSNLLVSPIQIESAPAIAIEVVATPAVASQPQVIEMPQPATPQVIVAPPIVQVVAPAIEQPIQQLVPAPVSTPTPTPVVQPTPQAQPTPINTPNGSEYASNGLIWCSALGRLPALGESCQLPFATTDYSMPTSVTYDPGTISFTGVPNASNTSTDSNGTVFYTPTFATGSPSAGPVSVTASGSCSFNGSSVVFNGTDTCAVTISQPGADSVTQFITPNTNATKES